MTKNLSMGMAHLTIELPIEIGPRQRSKRQAEYRSRAWEQAAGFAKLIDLVAGDAEVQLVMTRFHPQGTVPLGAADLHKAMWPVQLGVQDALGPRRAIKLTLAQAAEDRHAVRIELNAQGRTSVAGTPAGSRKQ